MAGVLAIALLVPESGSAAACEYDDDGYYPGSVGCDAERGGQTP